VHANAEFKKLERKFQSKNENGDNVQEILKPPHTLSGRKRSAMYLLLNLTAAAMASSV